MFSPAVWNNGAETRARSSAITSWSTRTLTAFHVRLPWVSIAPLGRPVVPEVYMMMQVSSAATGSSIGSSEAAASNWSYSAPTSTVRTHVAVARQSRDETGERRPVHEGLRAGVRQLVGDLGPGEAGVERYEDRPEGARGEQGLQVGGVVRAEVGDPVAAAHSAGAQGVREAGGALVQPGVRDRRAAVDQGGAVRGLAGPACGPRPQSLIAHVRAPVLRRTWGAPYGFVRPSSRAAFSLRIFGLTSSLMESFAKSASQRSGVRTG